MNSNNLIFKNNIKIKSHQLDFKKLSKKFDKIYLEIEADIKRKNRTLKKKRNKFLVYLENLYG